jgi:hypothetical protein
MKIKSNLLLIIGFALLLTVMVLCYNSEGFQAGMPGIRCGVDLPGCSNTKQCLNGFCSSTNKPALLANELPVYP